MGGSDYPVFLRVASLSYSFVSATILKAPELTGNDQALSYGYRDVDTTGNGFPRALVYNYWCYAGPAIGVIGFIQKVFIYGKAVPKTAGSAMGEARCGDRVLIEGVIQGCVRNSVNFVAVFLIGDPVIEEVAEDSI